MPTPPSRTGSGLSATVRCTTMSPPRACALGHHDQRKPFPFFAAFEAALADLLDLVRDLGDEDYVAAAPHTRHQRQPARVGPIISTT
jgi:hypothetical protein